MRNYAVGFAPNVKRLLILFALIVMVLDGIIRIQWIVIVVGVARITQSKVEYAWDYLGGW